MAESYLRGVVQFKVSCFEVFQLLYSTCPLFLIRCCFEVCFDLKNRRSNGNSGRFTVVLFYEKMQIDQYPECRLQIMLTPAHPNQFVTNSFLIYWIDVLDLEIRFYWNNLILIMLWNFEFIFTLINWLFHVSNIA